jgi:ATP-dependent RNA helicase DDX23/PRP28
MAGPLSVEDILAKQKAEKEAAAKPKFLSKAERAKLALEKRNAEVKDQQAREEEERSARIAFEQKLEEERKRSEESRYNGGGGPGNGRQGGYGRDSYRREDRYNQSGPAQDRNGQNGHGQNGNSNHDNRQGPPSGPRGAPSGPRSSYGNGNGFNNQPSTSSPLARDQGPSSSSAAQSSMTGSPKPNVPGDVSQPSDYEMAVIKSRYLGQKDPDKKQRARKEPNSKNKMNFDWNAADDTTAHEQGGWRNDVKANAPGAVMLGGRLAGFDEGGRRRGQVSVDDQYVSVRSHRLHADIDRYGDALERRRAGKGNNDDRHWSDKPLEEMKDRDWRIFREDYSISARGGSIPMPLRSWRESTIPESILSVIEDVGYTEPSPIQRQAIPIGMQNRDLIGIAKTGMVNLGIILRSADA